MIAQISAARWRSRPEGLHYSGRLA